VGYSLVEGRSDWILGADDEAIQLDLMLGWAAAAEDLRKQHLGPLDTDRIAGWLARRRQFVKLRRSTIRVSHRDFFATPIGAR
jgi:hypothetical protein